MPLKVKNQSLVFIYWVAVTFCLFESFYIKLHTNSKLAELLQPYHYHKKKDVTGIKHLKFAWELNCKCDAGRWKHKPDKRHLNVTTVNYLLLSADWTLNKYYYRMNLHIYFMGVLDYKTLATFSGTIEFQNADLLDPPGAIVNVFAESGLWSLSFLWETPVWPFKFHKIEWGVRM